MLATEFVCEPTRIRVSVVDDVHDEDRCLHNAYEQQLALRLKAGCPTREWKGRCPLASTMLLASTRAGCSPAGCVAVANVTEASAVLEVCGGNNERNQDFQNLFRTVTISSSDLTASSTIFLARPGESLSGLSPLSLAHIHASSLSLG